MFVCVSVSLSVCICVPVCVCVPAAPVPHLYHLAWLAPYPPCQPGSHTHTYQLKCSCTGSPRPQDFSQSQRTGLLYKILNLNVRIRISWFDQTQADRWMTLELDGKRSDFCFYYESISNCPFRIWLRVSVHFSIENVYIYGNSMWKTLSDENLFAEKIDKCHYIYEIFCYSQA